MFKIALVFAGGLVLGALGAAYLSGLSKGYEKAQSESASAETGPTPAAAQA